MGKKLIFILIILSGIAAALGLSYVFRRNFSNEGDRREALNLVVYASTSFMDAFGPGAEIKRRFEERFESKIEFVDSGGTALLIEKLKLDPSRRVDVILGLDLLLLDRAANTIKFQELKPDKTKFVSELQPFVYPRFAPYDWAAMGFVYRQGEIEPANSWADALKRFPQKSISLQDPEVSPSGLEFIYWVFSTVQDRAQFWREWDSKVIAYSPSWSSAYGFFRRGQAKAAFSYETSLLYHLSEEPNSNYRFMEFAEGHPVQIEFAGVPDSCWNCGMAKQFVGFLLEPEIQQLLLEKNYMRPAVVGLENHLLLSQLPKVKLLPLTELDQFAKERDTLIEEWRKSLKLNR